MANTTEETATADRQRILECRRMARFIKDAQGDYGDAAKSAGMEKLAFQEKCRVLGIVTRALDITLEIEEGHLLLKALHVCNHNMYHAARRIGISAKRFLNRMNDLGWRQPFPRVSQFKLDEWPMAIPEKATPGFYQAEIMKAERTAICKAVNFTHGNLKHAAFVLAISGKTLTRLMAKHAITPENAVADGNFTHDTSYQVLGEHATFDWM